MKPFSRIILPLLLFIYIAVETYAKLHHTSLCGTEGCELAGELLRYNSLYLNYFGGAGALFIMLFGWLSLRREGFERIFFITLYAAIAFESIMIAYQLLANPEPCIFCLGVYGALLTIALLSRWRYLLYGLPAIVALYLSMASLAVTQNRALITADGSYLIHSESCPHCKKVKNYFAAHDIPYQKISIRDSNARFFIKQLDINTIPVLIIKKGGLSTVLKGDRAIIGYYEQHNAPAKTVQNGTEESPSIYNGPDEGCSASIFQDSGCSEASEVPLH